MGDVRIWGCLLAFVLLQTACLSAPPPATRPPAEFSPTSTAPALVAVTNTKPALTAPPAATLTRGATPTSLPPSPTGPPPSPTNAASSTPPPTNTAVPTAPATATALPTPLPPAVNGVPADEIVIMPPEVRRNIRAIYARGQALGRNGRAFSKLGDSVTLTDHYLTRFDSGFYNLGEYAYLQTAIDHYAGSFGRYGVASKVGLHAWAIFDPLWADKEWCLANEDMLACEIRLNNPSVIILRLGSNDSGPGAVFEENMRLVVEYAVENGVIPVLATKADRFEGPDNRNNLIMRALAEEYSVPLWDYDRVAETLPRRGLGGDDVHMTMADADDYTKAETFERGYPVNDLTALMVLHAIYEEVTKPDDA